MRFVPHRRWHRSIAARLLVMLAAAWFVALIDDARAQQTFEFDPPGAAVSFETSTNWSPNGPPGVLDTARFNDPGTYAVVFNSSPTNDELEVFDGDVTFRPLLSFQNTTHTYTISDRTTIDGGDLTLTNNGNEVFVLDGEEIFIGEFTAGAFSVENGADASHTFARIGDQTSGIGRATVDGSGSTWTNTDFNGLFVGNSGQGTLNITGGGSVSNLGSRARIGDKASGVGEAIVDGSGSSWTNSGQLVVANAGNGTLNITGGGSVSNPDAFVGNETGGTGEATVDGAGSTWTNFFQLFVGNFGSGTLNITGGGSVSNTDAFVGNETGSTGEATVDGAGSSWTNFNQLFVGNAGTGTLNITGGGSVSNTGRGWVGLQHDSTGEVLVDGAGSSWTNADQLVVGRSGSGTLKITGGGSVSNTLGHVGEQSSSSTSEVLVDGADSNWTNSDQLNVGFFGTGTLNITGGGSVSNNTFAFVGRHFGSTGEVSVEGAGSSWTNSGPLVVGSLGTGTLKITSGGSVSNSAAFVGDETGSTGEVSVEGAGSTWTNDGSLFVGGDLAANGGAGTVNIGPGASVSVSQPTRVWTDGQLNLLGGTFTTNAFDDQGGIFSWQGGALNITGPAGVSLGSTPLLGDTLNLGGSQSLGVTNKLTVETSSQLSSVGGNVTASEIEIEAGGVWTVLGGTQDMGTDLENNGSAVFIGTTVDGPVTSPAGSDITVVGITTFNDLVSGAGGIFGPGTAVFNGGHDPGDSVATVPVEGNLAYGDTNTLFIELEGSEIGEFDRLEIGGSVDLGGELEVLADPAIDLSIGETLVFINALGGIFNAFDSLAFPTLDNGKALRLFYGETIVALEVVLAGDYNGDGLVNAADYTVWRDTLGQSGIGLAADGTGPSGAPDGVVDGLDYQFWVDNFGNSAGSGSASHLAPGASPGANFAVPEPATLSLATLAVLAWLTFRRRRGC